MTKKKDAKKDSKKESEEKVNFKLVSKPVQMMDITLIDLTGWNPRGEDSFKDEAFEELKQSMKENGFFVHEPLLIRAVGDRFQLIGGHRRLQAAKDLNFEVVPVVIRDINDPDAKLLIFIDNLHRKDFSPLEEAQGIKQVLDDGSVTQTELAKKMGKSQAYVANRLRLLDAPQELKDLVISQEITPSHVNVLLPFIEYPVYGNILEVLMGRLEDKDQGPLSVKDLELDIIESVVGDDESIFDNLDQFPYDSRKFQEFFDFTGCQDCKGIVLVKDSDEKEQRCCMNQACWSVRLENAEIKWGEAEMEKKEKVKETLAEQVRVDKIPLSERQCLTYVSFKNDEKAMAECKSCNKCKPDDDGDLTCLDVECYRKKEKAWRREDGKRAREEDKQVFALMDEKLSGISCLGETELRFIILRLSRNIIWSQACKKAYKPWEHLVKQGRDYPAVADIPAGELLHLLLRLIIIQRMNGGNGLASMDQFNSAIEGLGV